MSDIIITGARQHNLKNVNVRIPRDSLTVVTGLSGSGKSSLAFDTLFAEGQRRYVESLSTYARQFLQQFPPRHIPRSPSRLGTHTAQCFLEQRQVLWPVGIVAHEQLEIILP